MNICKFITKKVTKENKNYFYEQILTVQVIMSVIKIIFNSVGKDITNYFL